MSSSSPIDIWPDHAWFTSDLHFGHANVIEYCTRPFTSVGEMDNVMTERWNARVQPEDTVFVVGDFTLHTGKRRIREYRDRLKGRIILVRGNHDARRGFDVFDQVEDLLRVRVHGPNDAQTLILCHYGMEVWDGSHHGSWHLHGHSHGTLPRRGRRLDVGVDDWAFAPVSYAQVARVLSQAPFERVDAHGETHRHPRGTDPTVA